MVKEKKEKVGSERKATIKKWAIKKPNKEDDKKQRSQ